ncbi:peptidase S8/S53 domain-containing protein [Mycena polygramma]|nr:peptidase S8/S53 domain-containing protein [Mycena polygramma]
MFSTTALLIISLLVHHASSAPLNGSTWKRAALQNTASWGLARISQKQQLSTLEADDEDDETMLPKRAISSDWTFPHDDTWGDGVSGIGSNYKDLISSPTGKWGVPDGGYQYMCHTHAELVGRVRPGWVLTGLAGQATEDACDHGVPKLCGPHDSWDLAELQTAVASLVAGKTLGVARMATIVPVRIADESRCALGPTTAADAAAGIQWAIADFRNQQAHAKAGIINISWQVYQTSATEAAFKAAVDAGMHVIVSAGNNGLNECAQRVQDVGQIVVGMTDYEDSLVSMPWVRPPMGSNFGPCVTLFAPGFSMSLASNRDDSTIARGMAETGTSFSAPLVSGTIAALGKFYSKGQARVTHEYNIAVSIHGNLTPDKMKALLLQNALNPAGIKDLQGSADILLQSPLAGTSEVQ